MATTTETATTVLKDKTIPISTFDTISLAHLETRDPATVKRLLAAAVAPGWFYLDLRGSSAGKAILPDLARMYEISGDYFMQATEVKAKDARGDQRQSQDRGYKTSYCDETFEMARDEILSDTIAWPPALNPHRETLAQFSNGCHLACETLIASLSDALQLDPEQRFERHHRDNHPSDSGLKLIYEPSLPKLADVGDNLHTDSGSLTLLFYDKWGLSAYTASQRGFAFTPPLGESVALINVADSLQRLSGGRLVSPKHRVTQPVDGAEKRYYISYFLRPEDATKEAWAKV